jgi:hypothetical protein
VSLRVGCVITRFASIYNPYCGQFWITYGCLLLRLSQVTHTHTHTQTLVSNLVGIIIIIMLLLLFLLVGNILLWHIVGQKICNLYCILTFKKKLKKKRDDLYLKHLVHNSRHSMSSSGYASYTRQLMQTSWLRCHATHNQDKVPSLYLPNDLRNQYVIKYYQPFFPCVARMNKETFFFFGKLTYVLKEEDTNIIRGIPQIYNDNRNIKQQMATG